MNRVLTYLDAQDAAYEVIAHRIEYTSQETAADTHTPGREFAKNVLLGTPAGVAMAIVPAIHKIDLEKVRQGLGTNQVRLADEAMMSELCPDCDPGAIPPFGNLYDIPVYVDPTLTGDEFITFNGGTHESAIRMRYCDFERLVHPTIMDMVEGA